MKQLQLTRIGWLGVLAVLLVGCRHKTDAKTELEKAATVLAQGENTQPAPAPPPAPEPQPAPAVETPAPVEPVALPTPTASQQMQQALASYKTGQLEDAVTRLQKLRTMPTLTAQQRMALQESVAAVMNEVYEMAAKGDGRAIAAVKQYESMQTAPRR
jgi:PBP1b-binding outer membrane lipoprotein LpoB